MGGGGQARAQCRRFGAGDSTRLTTYGSIALPPIVSSLPSSGQGQQEQCEPDKNRLVETIGSQKLLSQIEAHRVDYWAVASVDEPLGVDGVETTKPASLPFGMGCTQSMDERLGAAEMTSLHPKNLSMLPGNVPFATLNRNFVHT